MVQLSFKVTFARIRNAFYMHCGRISCSKKGVAVNQVLLQLYHKVLHSHGQFSYVHVPDASRARSGLV